MLLTLLQQHRQRLRPLHLDDEATRTMAGLVQARRTLLVNQLICTVKDYFSQALRLVGEGLAVPLALDFLKRWPRLTGVQAAKDITFRNSYHRHNVRQPERIQSRLDLVRSSRLLTREPAVIEVNVRLVRLLVAELRVVDEHIVELKRPLPRSLLLIPSAVSSESSPALVPRSRHASWRLLARCVTSIQTWPPCSVTSEWRP